MSRLLKVVFFALIIKPIALLVLGLNIRNRRLLPTKGPAIIAANHNSHLDTMVLMSLYPLSQIHKIRPVAAADYFLANRYLAWFSLNVIGIIPLNRSSGIDIDTDKESLFESCQSALNRGDVLILFPEGTRGDPEKMSKLKKGVYYLAKVVSSTQVVPVVLHGLGRALPRGEALLVPFNCDVIIGQSLSPNDYANSNEFIESLSLSYDELERFCLTKNILD